jgi:hypothetical protein
MRLPLGAFWLTAAVRYFAQAPRLQAVQALLCHRQPPSAPPTQQE